MSGISTHVLDTALGRPAAGVPVVLERADGQHWLTCASTVTDPDGRCPNLLPLAQVTAGRFRLTFATAAYFAALRQPIISHLPVASGILRGGWRRRARGTCPWSGCRRGERSPR